MAALHSHTGHSQAHFNVNAHPGVSFSRHGLIPVLEALHFAGSSSMQAMPGPPNPLRRFPFQHTVFDCFICPSTQRLPHKGAAPQEVALGAPCLPCAVCTPPPPGPARSGGVARPPRPASCTCSPRGASRRRAVWGVGWRTACRFSRRQPAGPEKLWEIRTSRAGRQSQPALPRTKKPLSSPPPKGGGPNLPAYEPLDP